MQKQIILAGKTVKYNLEYKNVKNINLKIKSDGTMNVSANRRISEKVIEKFLISKADFILRALEYYENRVEMPNIQYFSENEIRKVIEELCKGVYPYFKARGVAYPVIKFRRMVSRWGSCHSVKGILTFNLNLMYAPPECVRYVVLHEFTHFLQANHSEKFYAELEKVCPDWKSCRKKLKLIHITKDKD